jgi:hypothetical protein
MAVSVLVYPSCTVIPVTWAICKLKSGFHADGLLATLWNGVYLTSGISLNLPPFENVYRFSIFHRALPVAVAIISKRTKRTVLATAFQLAVDAYGRRE